MEFEAESRREFMLALCGIIPLGAAFTRIGAEGNPQPLSGGWQSLFDGTSLGEWEETPFGGEGLIRVKDETIILEFGEPLTGITWRGPVARMDYEVRLEAQRLAGNDFFCGLHLPSGRECLFVDPRRVGRLARRTVEPRWKGCVRQRDDTARRI